MSSEASARVRRLHSKRRARLEARLAKATTASEQIAAATDFLRSVVAGLPTSEAYAVADEAVAALTEIADNALKGSGDL